MAYDGKLLARARGRLDEIRAANSAEHQRRLTLIYSSVPEIRCIDNKLRAQMTELVRLTVSRKGDIGESLNALKESNIDLQMRRAELLTEHGYPVDYLDDIYSCRVCRDTGVSGTGVCTCLEKLYNRELTEELGTLIRRGDESFESFDLSLYSDRFDPDYNVVPRDAMKLVYNACRKFADSFPNVSSNLLLQGGTGLGKTYLSACIARTAAAKGYSVCYESASLALEAFEKQKFSRDEDEAAAAAKRVERMLDCDLMILDDLGTEMVTQLSLSALYTLINTRLVSKKPTVISTNCSDKELERRYTPQICSRIAGEFLHLPFAGQDIRLAVKR